jgi:pimeloyl-ACP methyl ester carboxylesterase
LCYFTLKNVKTLNMKQVLSVSVKTIFTLSVAALAGCAVLADRQSAARISAAERKFPPMGQFIDVNGRKVHAVVAGNGPNVVLIHGAGGNSREFTFAFMDLLTNRYRVIVFDRPGLGFTERASKEFEGAFNASAESPSEQAAMLQAAAAQLGAEMPIVVGHSYGGSVALSWAMDHPNNVAGVVNIAGPSHPWPGNLSAYYKLNGSAIGGALVPPLIAAFATSSQIKSAVEDIFTPQSVPDGYIDFIGATLTMRPESFRANARQVNTLHPHIIQMSTRYSSELTVPLEIIHGNLDTTVPLNIHSIPLKLAVPHANLTILEGIGHMPHHTAPEVVEAAINRIVEQKRLR